MNTVGVITRKLIKPATPTPPHLKTYKFSFTDENLPAMEVGILLFYSSQQKQINFEQSLAETLVQFYPLAGRFIFKDHAVDCSDQGAELVEAEAPAADLASLVHESDLGNLYPFLPSGNHKLDPANYPILSAQITRLGDGGLVIGISISHKIFDASSVGTFISAWANATNPSGEVDRVTVLDSSSLFPGKSPSQYSEAIIHGTQNHTIDVKRFTFNKEAIATLRSSLKPNERVSRVRIASAVIAKALIQVDRVKLGRLRDCLITQAVNIRARTNPPLHKHACGNLVILSVCRFVSDSESEVFTIQELVDLLGKATTKSISDCGAILSLDDDERYNMVVNPLKTVSNTFRAREANVLTFTDYSKFGLYEADFGFGKPVWAAIAPQASLNVTVMMENKEGDGIEAWVHLDKNDMRLFEEDEEIRLVCKLG